MVSSLNRATMVLNVEEAAILPLDTAVDQGNVIFRSSATGKSLTQHPSQDLHIEHCDAVAPENSSDFK